MTTPHDPNVLPADIPAPQDDGAARHLAGLRLPSLALAATDGSQVDLSKLTGRTVVYIYPRTGVPGQPLPEGWDAIPGARGCTPQSCSFRDHFAELKRLGVAHLYGLSTQDTDYQREAAERLQLPFPVLSDAALEACARDRAADVHGRRHDAAQAHGAGDRRRRHHQGVLSGVPAGQERRGGDRLATRAKRVVEIGAHAARTRRTEHPASARRYWCCSASSDSCRKARSLPISCACAVAERRGRARCAERGDRAVMGDPAERDDGAQVRHLGDRRPREMRGRS